ncbi:11789_t:CDS:1 [Scutellospora calospora]|uniref:11789_t:CDS:1 n=1 Tax=Scutellospora calospora TaxID=85575 RepID=A0ACA9MV13_9GLOM|nr:11789_t:CDS:1 [Scutellospora calospora]
MSVTTKALQAHNSSIIELKVTLKGIPKLDLLSQSDPQVFLFLKNPHGNDWLNNPHSQTERIENESNPSFETPFILEYHFEELQRIKFIAVDVDKRNNLAWNEQELIGEFVTDIGSILGKSKGILKGKLILTKHPGKDRGQIIIVGRELPPENGKAFSLKVQGRNLHIPTLLTKPDVFYQLSRRIQGNSDTLSSMDVLIHKSERCKSKNPDWSIIKLFERDLQNENNRSPNDEVSFTCWQHKHDGNHKCIGERVLKINELLSSNHASFQQISLVPKGELWLQCTFEKTFLDYIAGGLEIQLSVAID